MPDARHTLCVMPEMLAVCRIEPTAPIPDWVPNTPFVSVTRTRAELSIVCPAEAVPSGVLVDAGWRCLELQGPFDFGVTGVIAALATALANAGVGILPIATYDTDYILTKDANLARAVHALERAGHVVREAKRVGVEPPRHE